ncbi:hypothetical protein R1flu_022908 [Riccia fluitans]|uniref:Uncharacterized protein n=1 Tax=Riccia fluitans TaxID=41844 RepID=A0ABD1XTJ9_9MARC
MARDCLARVTTGVAVGGAVGGAIGAVYGTYEAFRFKVPDEHHQYDLCFSYRIELLVAVSSIVWSTSETIEVVILGLFSAWVIELKLRTDVLASPRYNRNNVPARVQNPHDVSFEENLEVGRANN